MAPTECLFGPPGLLTWISIPVWTLFFGLSVRMNTPLLP